MKNIKFMALISPLILCGCSSTPEPAPTVTTYAVALQSGEGTFSDGKTCIVLNNVIEGTPLNEIEGYITPSGNLGYIFNSWLNEGGEEVSPSIEITCNTVLTASYEKNPETARKQYIEQIETERTTALTYATNKQIQRFKYDKVVNNVIDVASRILNDKENVNSIPQMGMIYDFSHLCLGTLDKIDVVMRPSYPDVPYDYISGVFINSVKKYANKSLTIDQLETIHNLSQALLLSYWRTNDAMSDIYEIYTAKAANVVHPLELKKIEKIGCGLIRGCSRIQEKLSPYDIYVKAEAAVNEKIIEIETLFKEDKLSTMIDCLGSAASIYCKYGSAKYEDTIFDKVIYPRILQLLQDTTDPFAKNKLEMLLAFIEADGYYIPNDVIDSEWLLLQKINEIFQTPDKAKYADGITEIIVHGANALKPYNDHYSATYSSFVTDMIKSAVDAYIETESFLDCAIYAMDAAAQLNNIISEDLFLKEYETSRIYSANKYIDYLAMTSPFNEAYNLYKTQISTLPNNKLEALKIVVKGIIATSKIGGASAADFVSQFKISGLGTLADDTISASSANAFAYACTGLNYVYSYLPTLIDNTQIYNKFIYKVNVEEEEKIYWICQNWIGAIDKIPYENIKTFVGKAIALSWQEGSTRIAQACGNVGKDQDAVDNIFVNAEKWFKIIQDCIKFIDSQEAFYAIKHAIISTLNCDKYYYYSEIPSNRDNDSPWSDEINLWITVYDSKINEILPSLFGKIYSSTTSKQFVDRANIYINQFIKLIDCQNNSNNFKNNIDELRTSAINAMNLV